MKSIILASCVSILSAACADDDSNLVETARDNGNFTTLVSALEATGLDQTLGGSDDFTVFAPTDDAFDRLPAGLIDSLDAETLSQILTYHVAAGSLLAEDVTALDTAGTVEGAAVSIDVEDGSVYLNTVTQVTATDISTSNGIIHSIDSVMLPPTIDFPGTVVDAAIAYPRFSTLVDSVVSAELDDDLATDNGGAGFTVFAPTNEAFTALGGALQALSSEELTNVLLYHVVGDTVDSSVVAGLDSANTLLDETVTIEFDGSDVIINGTVRVARVDLRVTNGIIHVIDGVLLPE